MPMASNNLSFYLLFPPFIIFLFFFFFFFFFFIFLFIPNLNICWNGFLPFPFLSFLSVLWPWWPWLDRLGSPYSLLFYLFPNSYFLFPFRWSECSDGTEDGALIAASESVVVMVVMMMTMIFIPDGIHSGHPSKSIQCIPLISPFRKEKRFQTAPFSKSK